MTLVLATGSLFDIKKYLPINADSTLIGFSMSPAQRDRRGTLKGLQQGFKLYFTTWYEREP